MIKTLTALGAAMLAALALAAPAGAATWEDCGSIRASIDGVPSSTEAWAISPHGTLACSTARRMGRSATRQAFPTRVRIGRQVWRARDPHSTADSFTITYRHGRYSVQLDTTY
jgi:hypothetical protein